MMKFLRILWKWRKGAISLIGLAGMISPSWAFLKQSQSQVTYKGTGKTQVATPGTKIKRYKVEMGVDRLDENSVKVHQKYFFDQGKTLESAYIVTHKGRQYYELFNMDMVRIGFGYCFGIVNGKKCHYKFELAQGTMDQFFSLKDNLMYRMGNLTDAQGNTEYWREGFVREVNLPTP